MENKLRQLYLLQQIDNHLDELEEMKGDLPAEVRELEEKVEGLQEQLHHHDETMKKSFLARDETDNEILSLREKLEKYKNQQFNVRTNKEYDALTKEMDHATERIAKLEKEMELFEAKATSARSDIDDTKTLLEESKKQLKERRTSLAEVSKTTEEEELRYQHERQKIVPRISKSDLANYERIRKAKGGKALVPVKRGACGGCYTTVPPQKLLELRQNNKLYACERCGRILVSDEIAENTSV